MCDVMLSLPHRRIKIHPHMDESSGALGLRFQHPAPVDPGVLGNVGWKEEEHLARQALEVSSLVPMTNLSCSWTNRSAAGRDVTFEMIGNVE